MADDDQQDGTTTDDTSDSAKDWQAEAEKWKTQSRKHEDRAKANSEAAKRLADLEAANASDIEKAVKAARDEGRAEAHREATPRIVRAEFRAAAKGVLSKEQTDALLEDLDLSKYVTDTGDVDEARVAKKVQAFAPAKDDKANVFPDLGQGRRDQQKVSAADYGRAEAERRFGTKK